MKEIYKIQDLEQVRLLSDPLKLSLIQAFAEGPRTTKDVAKSLNERVTKLYRHVDALHDAGLLEVVEEKQKRGTIERTFQAIAQRFEADYALFNEEAGEEGEAAARDMLQVVWDEILGVVANAQGTDDENAVIMRVRGKASPEKIDELQNQLQNWIESLPQEHDDSEAAAVDFGGLIAFYKLEEQKKGT